MGEFKVFIFTSIRTGCGFGIVFSVWCQFEIVVMPVINEYRIMLYKKLVYTSITRAKRSLILLGDPLSFSKAVYNKGNKERNTNLKNILTSNIL